MFSRRCARLLLAGVLAAAALPAVYLAVLNGVANTLLPAWLSRRPDRLTVGWDFVWMWVPGEVVELRGLRIAGAGPERGWRVSAATATGSVDLWALSEQRVELSALQADGVQFESWRAAGPPRGGRAWPLRVQGAARLARLVVDGRAFVGELDATGVLAIDGDLDAEVAGRVGGGALRSGGEVVATALAGEFTARLDGWELGVAPDRTSWSAVSGRAALRAEIESLSFLEPYLEGAPWLGVVGAGALAADVRMERGTLLDGSRVDAETRDLAVRFQGYHIVGDGVVEASVGEHAGMPASAVVVRFGAYTIGEPGAPPLVEGQGFTVTATSPDVSLAAPFTTVDVVLELPSSQVPHLPSFDAFLPTDLGLRLLGGRASVRGWVAASTRDGLANGRAELVADDVTAVFGDLGLSFDLELVAPLREGDLEAHVYDFSGTTLSLRDLGLSEPEAERREWWTTDRTWWATFAVPRGRALVGRDEYLDAELSLEAADSTAFVRLLSQRKPLPPWLQKALALPDVRGTGHLRLGTGHLELAPLALTAGRHYEAGLRWRREGQVDAGEVYAAWRGLAVGFRFTGDERELVPFDARRWFADGAVGVVGDGGDPPVATDLGPPPEDRAVIRWRKKAKTPRPPK
jgi:hypothetical protein